MDNKLNGAIGLLHKHANEVAKGKDSLQASKEIFGLQESKSIAETLRNQFRVANNAATESLNFLINSLSIDDIERLIKRISGQIFDSGHILNRLFYISGVYIENKKAVFVFTDSIQAESEPIQASDLPFATKIALIENIEAIL